MSKNIGFNNVSQANAESLKLFSQGNRVVIKPQDSALASLDVYARFHLAMKDSLVLTVSGLDVDGLTPKLTYVSHDTITDSSEIVGLVTFTSLGHADLKGILGLSNATSRKLEKSYYIGLTLVSGKVESRVLGVKNGNKWTSSKDCSAWGVIIGLPKLALEFKDVFSEKRKIAWKWNRTNQALEKVTPKEAK